MLNQQPILIASPSQSRGFYEVCTTGVTLSCGRYLLDHLTENKEGTKVLTALLFEHTLIRSPLNILYTPRDNALLRDTREVRLL